MAVAWEPAGDYEDILYGKAEGIARISINRPEVHNAFRPETVFELIDAFQKAREDPEVGVVLFTGEGGRAFCSGGDQRVRVAMAATWARTTSRASTSPTCTSSSAPSPFP